MALNDVKEIPQTRLRKAFSDNTPRLEFKRDAPRSVSDTVDSGKKKKSFTNSFLGRTGSLFQRKPVQQASKEKPWQGPETKRASTTFDTGASRDSFLERIDFDKLGLVTGKQGSLMSPVLEASEPLTFDRPRFNSTPVIHHTLQKTAYDNDDGDNKDDTYQIYRMTKITDSLYLGNDHDAEDEDALRKAKITHVLSMVARKFNKKRRAKFDPAYRWLGKRKQKDIKRKCVPMSDTGQTDVGRLLEEKDVLAFMRNSQKKNKKLLVHCQLGQNRSPTIVIAFLMKEKHFTLHQAWRWVKQKRVIVQPNVKYVQQLRQWDVYLHGKHSTPNDFLHLKVSGDGEQIHVEHEHANTLRMTSVMNEKMLKMKKKHSHLGGHTDSESEHTEELDFEDEDMLSPRSQGDEKSIVNTQDRQDKKEREPYEAKTNDTDVSNNNLMIVTPKVASSSEDSTTQSHISDLGSPGRKGENYKDAIKADQRSSNDLNID